MSQKSAVTWIQVHVLGEPALGEQVQRAVLRPRLHSCLARADQSRLAKVGICSSLECGMLVAGHSCCVLCTVRSPPLENRLHQKSVGSCLSLKPSETVWAASR